jgi:hypothetical protein
VYTIHSATVHGEILRRVRCENCSHEYAYHMVRSVTADSFDFSMTALRAGLRNPGRADRAVQQTAEETLLEQLEKECDPVPCPACGWYQDGMIAYLKKHHHRWLAVVGKWLLFGVVPWAAIIILLSFEIGLERVANIPVWYWTVPAFLVGIGAALIWLQRRMAETLQPNATLQENVVVGKARALSKEELDALLQQVPDNGEPRGLGGNYGHHP